MWKIDEIAQIFITNKMAINLNMLGSLMKNKIFNNPNGTFIIVMKRCEDLLRKSKIKEQSTKPDYFRTSSKHGTIFRFSGRFGNFVLFLAFLRNEGINKMHTPSDHGMMSIRVSNAISIVICN